MKAKWIVMKDVDMGVMNLPKGCLLSGDYAAVYVPDTHWNEETEEWECISESHVKTPPGRWTR